MSKFKLGDLICIGNGNDVDICVFKEQSGTIRVYPLSFNGLNRCLEDFKLKEKNKYENRAHRDNWVHNGKTYQKDEVYSTSYYSTKLHFYSRDLDRVYPYAPELLYGDQSVYYKKIMSVINRTYVNS